MDRVTTLETLWSAWAGHGRALTEDQWTLPTRLDTWDVRSLYAHAASWPAALLPGLLAAVQEAPPSHTAAALLRAFNTPDGNANRLRAWNATAARDAAAASTPTQMIDQFAVAGPRLIAAARHLGAVTVNYFGQAFLSLDEATAIAVMEATVHLLDLQRALDLPPDIPTDALTQTAALLTAMTPPIPLIEAATGRATITPFPVLT